MQIFFIETDRVVLLNRVDTITSTSERKWGTMNVDEMLLHLRMQIELALGIQVPEKRPSSYLSLPFFRWIALYGLAWPKGSPTAPEMDIRKRAITTSGFDGEKQLLLQRLYEIQQHQSFQPHPLFGKMSKNLWGRLIWKHIDHHLRQFGI